MGVPLRKRKGTGLLLGLLGLLGCLLPWDPPSPFPQGDAGARTELRTGSISSPYPCIEVRRRRDGRRGHLVYALIDQIPDHWPCPLGLDHQHVLGFWRFVPAGGAADNMLSRSYLVGDASQPYGGNPLTNLAWIITPNAEGPPEFVVTPVGRDTLAAIARCADCSSVAYWSQAEE
jgi:hypothetical protein